MIDTTKRLHLAVVGDLLVDVWHSGKTERTAQEGGQPIFDETGEPKSFSGGAANVLAQLAHWNVEAELFGCNCGEKHRYCTRNGYMLRIDHDRCPGEPEREHMMAKLLSKLRKFDGVLVSDYDKGSFDDLSMQKLIAACTQAGVPCFVDPKNKSPTTLVGATVVKCNATYLHKYGFRTDGDMVSTRGPHGPFGIADGKPFKGKTRRAVPVESVVGAGDCFHAAMACALLRGLSLPTAAEIGYCAGRCYVQHSRNRPVHPVELHLDLDMVLGKLIDCNTLRDYLNLRKPDRTGVVFTNGVFDGIHPGHLHTLRWAKAQGDLLIVAINDDASAARVKPGRTRLAEADRAVLLAALECVDFVVSFSEDTPIKAIETLRPSVLIKGYDTDPETIPGKNLSEVRMAPPCDFILHTTDLRKQPCL